MNKKEYRTQILGELGKSLKKAKNLPDSADYKAERVQRLTMLVEFQLKEVSDE